VLVIGVQAVHAAPPPAPPSRPSQPAISPRGADTTAGRPGLELRPPAKGSAGDTRCILCHTVKGWQDSTFAHDKTGFPLRGMHRKVACKDCHPVDFKAQVPDRCSGCHRDVHAEEFGLQCEGCHDEQSWHSKFNADAHRATNFPLTGRHALLPCTECHRQVRDRGFSRAAVACVTCHLADYQQTATTSIDHQAAGFATTCQQCHVPWTFQQARFPDHDRCFPITRGPHASVRCLTCHTSLQSAMATGACATNTAACSACHEHQCARSDAVHAAKGITPAMGYQCRDQLCYQCHKTGQ
jgi:hypothetical protein